MLRELLAARFFLLPLRGQLGQPLLERPLARARPLRACASSGALGLRFADGVWRGGRGGAIERGKFLLERALFVGPSLLLGAQLLQLARKLVEFPFLEFKLLL